jgi:hypothetical protein
VDLSVYESLAIFFDTADPRTDADKALIVGYWFQKHDGVKPFDSQAVNKELSRLGHGVVNITSAFDSLKDQKPALVVSVKSGKSRQARKKYSLTVAGERAAAHMVAGQ